MGGLVWILAVLLCCAVPVQADFAGRVVGLAGDPLPGATAFFATYPTRSGGRFTPGSAAVGADGRFVYPTNDVGGYVWVVNAETCTEVSPVKPGEAVELRATRGRVVRGEVVGRDQQPVVGAEVALRGVGHFVLASGRAGLHVQADAQGRFALGPLPLTASVELEVSAPGLGVARRSVAVGVGTLLVILGPDEGLVPGTRLEGVALAGDRPLAAADFTLSCGRDRSYAASGANGEFECVDLQPGLWRVRPRLDRPVPGWVLRAPAEVEVARGRTSSVRLVLEPAGVVQGRVTSPSGRPLPAVVVRAFSQGEEYRTETGANGRYRLECPAGPVGLRCGRNEDVLAEAKLPPAALTEVDFEVAPRPTVAGQVVLPDGQMVQGARVSSAYPTQSVVTDANGRFALDFAEADGVPELSVAWTDPRGQRWTASQPGGVWPEDGQSPPLIRLVLAKAIERALTGRVVSAQGLPLADVAVGTAVSDGIGRIPAQQDWTTTDADGCYRLRLRPLPGDRSAEGDDHNRPLRFMRHGWRLQCPPTVTGDVDRVAEDAVMERLNGLVAGRVVDDAGRGIAGAQLCVEDCPPDAAHVSGPGGTFAFAMLPRQGQQTLVALSGDGLLAKARVAAGDTDVCLALAATVLPDAAARRRAAWRAIDALRSQHVTPEASAALHGVACALDPKIGLAWIGELPERVDQRRAWAAALPYLASRQPERALALLPEVEQVADPVARGMAVGRLVVNLPEALRSAARPALDRAIAALGTDIGRAGGKPVWYDLLPAMALLHDGRLGLALSNHYRQAGNSVEWVRLFDALWFIDDLGERPESEFWHRNDAAVLRSAARRAKDDPAAALAWMRGKRPRYTGTYDTILAATALAPLLLDTEPQAAWAIAQEIDRSPSSTSGLRGRLLSAMADVEEARRLFADLPPGTKPTGSLVVAARRLNPATAGRWLTALRGAQRTLTDAMDLLPAVPNLARLDLENQVAEAATWPRLVAYGFGHPPLTFETSHNAKYLEAFCALDPERAVDVAGSPLVRPELRPERLLYVARVLGGVDP